MLLSRHICNFANEISGRHRRGCWVVCSAEEVTKHLQLLAGVLRAAGVASKAALQNRHLLAVIEALLSLLVPEQSLLRRLQL